MGRGDAGPLRHDPAADLDPAAVRRAPVPLSRLRSVVVGAHVRHVPRGGARLVGGGWDAEAVRRDLRGPQLATMESDPAVPRGGRAVAGGARPDLSGGLALG